MSEKINVDNILGSKNLYIINKVLERRIWYLGCQHDSREEAWDSFGAHYLLTPTLSPRYGKIMWAWPDLPSVATLRASSVCSDGNSETGF